MKKRLIYIVFSLLLATVFSIAQVQAQDLLPYYPQISAYERYVAYDKGGDVYLFDGETNTEKKISTHNSSYGYAGITVLSTGVFWGEGGIGTGVYMYNFSSQETTKLVSLATLGAMEKNAELREFKMFAPNFFEYRLVKVGAADSAIKHYNVDTKKVYGQTDFDSYGSHGTETHGDKFEIFRLNSESLDSSKPVVSVGNIYEFESIGMDDNDLLMYGFRNTGSSMSEQFIEFRSHNTSNGMTLKIGDGSQNVAYADAVRPYSNYQFSYTNFILGQKRYEDGQPIPFYRLDRKSPYNSEFIVSVPSGQVRANGVDTLVWEPKTGTQTWYSLPDKKTCTLAKPLPIVNGQRMASRTFFFWREGNGMKAQKFTCVGENNSQNPPKVEPVKKPEPITQPSNTPKSLIKASGSPAVYYLGADGKRYVFYSSDLYFTWYRDFSSVKTISPAELSKILIGGNVTYRPGTLIKIQTDPRVYAVDRGGVLRWVTDERVANAIFGSQWSSKIRIIPDFLFTNYRLGDDIQSAANFNKSEAESGTPDINTDKGL